MTSAYCADCTAVCAACPQPRLLPENLPKALAYLRVMSQWRHHASGRISGLDYAGVEAALRLTTRSPKARTRIFGDIVVMEQAALQASAEYAAEAAEQRERERAGVGHGGR